MAGRQDPSGGQGAGSGRLIVRWRTFEDARKALETAAGPTLLLTDPGAAEQMGPRVLLAAWALARAAFPEADARVAIDCGASVDAALRALDAGWPALSFSGDAEIGAKLADMARQSGAELI